MTALERAKAFVNSRAAKTALKIMPLAVAAVATVTVTAPKAKADVALTSPTAFFQGCVGMCSGGFVIDNQTTSASQVSDTGFTGAVGSGNMSGHFSTSSSTDTPLHFYLSGGATGTGIPNTLNLSWDFNINTPTNITLDGVTVFFTYNGTVEGQCDASADTNGTADSCTVDLTGQEGFLGPLTSWNAFIEAQTLNPAGDTGTITWDVSYLAVTATQYPPTTPPGVPEPASMLLALSGLPLIGRFIRRKK